MVSTTQGIFSRGLSASTRSSFAVSISPLKGSSACVSAAASIVQSTAWQRRCSMWPLVVSKWELPGTMSPSFRSAEKITFSAARPWWVGRNQGMSNRRLTVSLRRKYDEAPA